jgi:hypothetical protein
VVEGVPGDSIPAMGLQAAGKGNSYIVGSPIWKRLLLHLTSELQQLGHAQNVVQRILTSLEADPFLQQASVWLPA